MSWIRLFIQNILLYNYIEKERARKVPTTSQTYILFIKKMILEKTLFLIFT